jgi:hypothetical protein
MEDKGVEGVEVAALGGGDEGGFVHAIYDFRFTIYDCAKRSSFLKNQRGRGVMRMR